PDAAPRRARRHVGIGGACLARQPRTQALWAGAVVLGLVRAGLRVERAAGERFRRLLRHRPDALAAAVRPGPARRAADRGRRGDAAAGRDRARLLPVLVPPHAARGAPAVGLPQRAPRESLAERRG